MTNAPERFELFVLPDGVKKLEIKPETKMRKAASFIIEREDHTLGNILRMQLHRDSNVLFAGYKVPHPLEHHIIVNIQTVDSTNPGNVMSNAINDLIAEFSLLEDRFKAAVAKAQSRDGQRFG